jgi:hypothetical protein
VQSDPCSLLGSHKTVEWFDAFSALCLHHACGACSQTDLGITTGGNLQEGEKIPGKRSLGRRLRIPLDSMQQCAAIAGQLLLAIRPNHVHLRRSLCSAVQSGIGPAYNLLVQGWHRAQYVCGPNPRRARTQTPIVDLHKKGVRF